MGQIKKNKDGVSVYLGAEDIAFIEAKLGQTVMFALIEAARNIAESKIKTEIPKTPVFAIMQDQIIIRFTNDEEIIEKAIRHEKPKAEAAGEVPVL